MIKTYEIVIVLPGTLTEEAAILEAKTMATAITELGGEGLDLAFEGKNRLAYPMRHIRYGYFFLGRFKVDGAKMPEIQAKLRLFPSSLRTLIQEANEKLKDSKVVFASMSFKAAPREGGVDNIDPEMEIKKISSAKPFVKSDSQEEKVSEGEAVDLGGITEKLDAILATGSDLK